MLVIKFKKKYVFSQDDSHNKEQFYTIYNNLEPNLSKKDSLLMVTSLTQTHKMAMTIGYFALALSEQRKRVLLIDANLRQPSLHDLFTIDNSVGLATILSGRKRQDEIKPVKVTEFLYCLPTGRVPFESSILFALESYPALLEDWKAHFDVILFHTSNYLNTPDAQIVAKHCDAIILVVQEGRDKFGKITAVKKQLEQNKKEITGTIIIS